MTSPFGDPVLRFENVSLGYDRKPVVQELDYAVNRGELLAIVGPNGAGKSTLLKGIIGEKSPLEGAITRGNLPADEIAYLPQHTNVDLSFPISVFDMVAMGCWRKSGAFGRVNSEDRKRVSAALASVGLSGMESVPIGNLSGGQTQRMLFARLVLQNASVILLDEPFRAIDTATVRDLMTFIHQWNGEKKTVIAVLHDLDLVRSSFPKALLLAGVSVASGDTKAVLSPTNLQRAQEISTGMIYSANSMPNEGRSALYG